MYDVETILGHIPDTATCHAETEEYRVKWVGYAPHSRHKEPAALLYDDVPHVVEAYWEDKAAPHAPALAGASEVDEPRSFKEAMASKDAVLWRRAADEEIESLMANKTWVLEKPPPGAKVIPVKWVFKIKRDAAGKIERYKARLVVKGFHQVEGRDYDEVFAPTGRHSSFRMLMALAAANDWELAQIDVKSAFLNGELDQTVYVAFRSFSLCLRWYHAVPPRMGSVPDTRPDTGFTPLLIQSPY
jgi:hypothetical protein